MVNIVRLNANNLLVDAATNKGIQVDLTTPTFGFRDVIGQIYPDTGGPDAPTLTAWRGNTRRFAYGVGDRMGTEIHAPHDLVHADIFIHFHVGHVGTSVAGNLVLDLTIEHTKVGNAAGGSNFTKQVSITDLATVSQFNSSAQDFLFATPGGGAGLLDTDLIEVDDSINIDMVVNAIPTITGGTSALPFIWNNDMHAQTTGVLGTKNKSAPFYG